MKKTFKVRHQCIAAGLVLLTLGGASACKKNESEQNNFKAETGALWWKKEATLVPLPYYLAKPPVPGQATLATDGSTLMLEDVLKSCWYYSEKPKDPFFSAKAVSPQAVTLDALLLGMSEGEHKNTLKQLRDAWIGNASKVNGGLQGWQVGAVTGAVLAVVAAAVVACTLSSSGTFAAPCAFIAAKIAAILPGATSLTAVLTVENVMTAAKVVGWAGSGVVSGEAVDAAVKNDSVEFSSKEFEAKLSELVSKASADKRMKVEWKHMEALKDVVMKSPSLPATADVCAKPEQLDRAAVAAYIGAANRTPTP
jgi:hypothetical protein